MKTTGKNFSQKILKHRQAVVFFIAVISWLPVLFLSFINDDIQILGYHSSHNFFEIFEPFWKADISSYYWRPVGNTLQTAIMLIFGMSPFVFRLVSLLIYSLCCVAVLKASEKIGLGERAALLSAVIFALLPSHELNLSWIAGQGEALVTIFLILAFINYSNIYSENIGRTKSIILAIVFFLIAVLIKETAYAGILIPVVVLVAQNNYTKKRIVLAARDVAYGAGIIILTLVYRYIVIGGQPFSSSHFSNFTIFTGIKNFAVYVPLSFFPPEMLEWLFYSAHNMFFLAIIVLVAIIVCVVVIRITLKMDSGKRILLAASALWFAVFVAPALPTLMRWYVFTASIGLVWILAVYINSVKKLLGSKLVYGCLFVVLAAVSVYDFSLMIRWDRVSKNFEPAVESIAEDSSIASSDSLVIWVSPDKIGRIPFMKLGVEQSVEWKLGKNMEVLSPFRAELVNSESRIELIESNTDSKVFRIINGRFIVLQGNSHYVIAESEDSGNIYGIEYRIETILDDGMPTSTLTLKYSSSSLPESRVYFNGNVFVKAL